MLLEGPGDFSRPGSLPLHGVEHGGGYPHPDPLPEGEGGFSRAYFGSVAPGNAWVMSTHHAIAYTG
jgi:hypothetical protein